MRDFRAIQHWYAVYISDKNKLATKGIIYYANVR